MDCAPPSHYELLSHMDSSSSCCVFNVEEEVVVVRNGWTPKKRKEKKTITEHISGFVDSIWQPLLRKISSYLKDTTHFHRNLNRHIDTLAPGSMLIDGCKFSLYQHSSCIRSGRLPKLPQQTQHTDCRRH